MSGKEPPARDDIVELSVDLIRQATALAAGLAEAGGLGAADLTGMRALDVLTGGEMTIGALAERMGLSSAAATGLMDRLEQAGLAYRRRDPDDRRRVLTGLTPKARTFGTDYLEPVLRRITSAAGHIPRDHVTSVRNFLAEVVTPNP